MFRGIELVIYDLDGVLIDSNQAILESFKRTMDEVGEEFKPDMIMKRIGYSLYQIFIDTMPLEYHGRLEELRKIYIKHFQSLDIKYTKLLPGVTQTLSNISNMGLLQSVATNKSVTEAERILLELGVGEYFALMAGFMTVEKPKPEPDMILYTLEELGVEPLKAVFVDDTNVGLSAGIKAGVHTIGITTGNNTFEQIEAVNPSIIIHKISDLPKILI
jgi:HAD superfamily hydrolase (TIGR01509 family)